jgi:nucleoid DNA-binding protein
MKMSNKVTYAEIIEALSREADFSKQKSEAFAKALIGRVKKELEESGKASITNFGSFKVKEVAERQGQNPRTGEPIIIPAHNRVSFTPYKALKEKVNAKYAHLKSELIGEKAGDSESEETSPLQTEQKPEEKSFFEKEKESTETKEPASDTIFQFDDEAIEDQGFRFY